MTMEPEYATDTLSDKDLEELLLPELKAVGEARPAVGALYDAVTRRGANGGEQPYAIGLALSGGGIRSATVSLGIMQKLAQAGILKEVDYLSTVSGGGYIGSALTWWLRDKRPPLPPYDTGRNFPFGITDPGEPETPLGNRDPQDVEARLDKPMTPLQYLRVQGNYLTPSSTINIWSGLAIVLRAMFLNLLVWIPLTAFAMLLLLWFGLCPIINGLPYMVNMSAPDLLTSVAAVTGSAGEVDVTATIPPAFLLMLLIAGVLLILFLLGSLNHSLLSWTNRTEAGGLRRAAESRANPAWRWLKAAAVGLSGAVMLGIVAFWLTKVSVFLFANLPQADGPYRTVAGWSFDLRLFIIAALITVLLSFALGGAQWINPKGFRQVWLAVLGLLGLLIADGIINIIIANGAPAWWQRLSALLQFGFGIAFLVYGFYVVGLLIRHVLRDEAAAQLSERFNVSNAFFLEYQSRRIFEIFFGAALRWAAVLIAIGSVPLVSSYINYSLGGIWAALGFAITLAGQWRGRVAGHGRFSNALIAIGAALFVYAIVLIGYHLAASFVAGTPMTRSLIFAAIILAALTGWFVNTNHIGLHRFYRDRLMEAFMPDDRTLSRDVNEAAGEANQFKLVDAWSDAKLRRPYHIVNTNLVLSNSKRRKFRLRGGDNFILSPLHLGSASTGWVPTAHSENADITLASAMAISAAAANPRGGAGGKGLTRSPTVSIVMSLLNIRLGYWLRNPKYSNIPEGAEAGKPPPEDGKPAWRPNHFWPGGVYGLSRGGYREDCAWLEIADGGHFENLAIYELVRRRCGLIIVCDGARDNASSYNDLVTAVQRIGEDFGATVRFDVGLNPDPKKKTEPADWPRCGPAQLIASDKITDYPKGAEFAERGYFVATIDYGRRGGMGWPECGTVIYLKSTLIKDLDIRAKGYRGAHADFPQQSTGDQFFDEEQFEAYREVGFRVAEQMVKELDLTRLVGAARPALRDLRSNGRFAAASA